MVDREGYLVVWLEQSLVCRTVKQWVVGGWWWGRRGGVGGRVVEEGEGRGSVVYHVKRGLGFRWWGKVSITGEWWVSVRHLLPV